MAKSFFWHGFTDMSVIKDVEPLTIARGEGAYLFDIDGRRYLDASAGLWYCNIGHGRTELAEAALAQMSRLESYSTFGDFTNEPVEVLAERLATLAPLTDASVFFTNGGSDAIDSAIKLVRRYWQALGKPERRVIISRHFAYHGANMGGTALGGIAADREGYGELITDAMRIAWDSAEELEAAVKSVGADRIAAFVCEPIIAAGGCLFPPEGYLDRVAEICRANGILLIADEVVTGFGRVGSWFASRRFEFEPDIIICAKGLTSGYLPMGALIVDQRVAEPFYDGTVGPWYHGYTYSGHATAAAVALANLDVIEREGLIENVLDLEPALPRLMAPLTDHPAVAAVRTGHGLLAAVEFNAETISRSRGRPAAVVAAMRRSGVLTRALVNGQIQFSPPLVVGREQVQEFVDAVLAGLEATSDLEAVAAS